jgi:hypothetical protein
VCFVNVLQQLVFLCKRVYMCYTTCVIGTSIHTSRVSTCVISKSIHSTCVISKSVRTCVISKSVSTCVISKSVRTYVINKSIHTLCAESFCVRCVYYV